MDINRRNVIAGATGVAALAFVAGALLFTGGDEPTEQVEVRGVADQSEQAQQAEPTTSTTAEPPPEVTTTTAPPATTTSVAPPPATFDVDPVEEVSTPPAPPTQPPAGEDEPEAPAAQETSSTTTTTEVEVPPRPKPPLICGHDGITHELPVDLIGVPCDEAFQIAWQRYLVAVQEWDELYG